MCPQRQLIPDGLESFASLQVLAESDHQLPSCEGDLFQNRSKKCATTVAMRQGRFLQVTVHIG